MSVPLSFAPCRSWPSGRCRGRWRWLQSLVASSLLLLLLGTDPSFAVAAEPPAEDTREQALRLGREGVDAYNAQRFEDAFDRFTHAEALVHSPVFVLYLARIARKRGRWIKALGLYDRVLGETLEASAPEPWRNAKQDAKVEREDLHAVIPTVRLKVLHSAEEITIWVDGRHVKDVGEPVPVDPGIREVSAQRGRLEFFRRLEIKEGDEPIVLEIDLGPRPDETDDEGTAGPATAGREGPAPDQGGGDQAEPDADDGEAQRIAGYVLLGTGGAALIAFVGVGIAALDTHRELDDKCLDGRCPKAIEDEVFGYDQLRNATVGLGIGAAAAAILGGILVGAAPSSASEEGVLAVGLGPGGVSISGQF